MALSGSTLKGDIKPDLKAKLQAFFGAPVDATLLDDFCDALADSVANKVIAHLTSAGVILPGTFTNSAGAVTGAGVIS